MMIDSSRRKAWRRSGQWAPQEQRGSLLGSSRHAQCVHNAFAMRGPTHSVGSGSCSQHLALRGASILRARLAFIGLASWFGVIAVVCCARREPDAPIRFGPTPTSTKPGQSLTNTDLCTCYACDPPECCGGPEEEREHECNTYDFSRCAIEVSSCSSRCYEHSWRVYRPKTCADNDTRPDVCCDPE